jgi:hypothetical protein
MVYTGHQKSNDYEHLDPCIPACIPPDVYTTVRRGAGRPSTVRRGAVRCGAGRRGAEYRQILEGNAIPCPTWPPDALRKILRTTLKHPTQLVGYYRILPDITRISVVISASETEYPPHYGQYPGNIRLRDRISVVIRVGYCP